jgi:hypothetical protein
MNGKTNPDAPIPETGMPPTPDADLRRGSGQVVERTGISKAEVGE